MLKLEDVFKTYENGTKALKGINLTIEDGEFVFIVGPSGSGKSTFLRCLNMLEKPTGGEIFFKGKRLGKGEKELNHFRQQVEMVFQHFNLFPHLTIRQNITLAPVKTGRATEQEAAEKADMLLKVMIAGSGAWCLPTCRMTLNVVPRT